MHRSPLSAAVLVAACLTLALPASSFAHAGIKSYSPKRGSTVARDLAAVRITFKRRIHSGNLIVRDASGTKISRGWGRVVSKHRAIRALLPKGLKAGRYKATGYWLNADSHVQIKSWHFRLR
jgi:methionine-rich copper-binding protein CopC